MSEGTLKIHSENILPIIKKWLYTEKEIFVRELVSNACDALSKRNKLSELGESNQPFDPKIEITIDSDKKQLIFSDTGLGMDAKEVETYIAQIAFSGAEEFAKKYASDKQEDQIIGHFGLGFYSAYMVASRVDIETLSYKENATSALWSSDGSTTYTLDEGKRETIGTTIVLHLLEDEKEFLDPAHLRTILQHYCAFLPFPIFLNGARINEKPPIWIKKASECTEQEIIAFYHDLFPMQPDPLFWVHLNVDYPFHLKGILFFPKITEEMQMQKEMIKLFCNRVFVSDNCKDLLPDYLTILRGAIDSPDIPLNVSRSTLQMDRTVRQLGAHISKKISDRLLSLYTSDREKFLACWQDIEPVIKFGMIQDDKFYERAKEFLVWKTTKNEWLSLDEVLERSDHKTVLYTPKGRENTPTVTLLEEKNKDILITTQALLDQALISFLEQKTDAKFQRVDATLTETLLDPTREKTLLDADGKTERSRLADFVKKSLDMDDLTVEAKSLSSEKLPALLLLGEQERRLRDQFARHSHKMGAALVKPTFVVNTNSPLINGIYNLKDKELAHKVLHSLYDLTRLSQEEMPKEALSPFIARLTEVIERLVN